MTNIYESTNLGNQEPAGHLLAAAVNSASAVSWGAIFAGAAAAASLALMLLMLGAGLGLTPFPLGKSRPCGGYRRHCRYRMATFTQIVASGMWGGYLAGRLRTKWVDTHTNEAYFRDTHGFLTWAVALLVSAVLLTTTISSLIGGSAKVVGSVAGARRQPP